MPIAASRFNALVGMASISLENPSSPMRMIAPFPYERWIWVRAVSNAFCF